MHTQLPRPVYTQQHKFLNTQTWSAGRIFFCTPHVVANDLKTGRCPAEAVVAIVIDECHRAQGGESRLCCVYCSLG